MDYDTNDEVNDILSKIPEDDYGNVEYKRLLTNKSDERLNELATQMRFRMAEGNGNCKYILGKNDDGSLYGLNEDEYKESYDNLRKVADMNDYSIRLLTETKYKNKKVCEFFIRENNIISCEDVRIAVTGNVDATKCLCRDSTIIMSNGKVKKVQDIVINDLVMGDDSKPRRVLTTYSGRSQLYRITPLNGDYITVTKNHVLCFKASNYNYIYYDKSIERYGIRHLKYQPNRLPKLGTTFFPIYRESRKYHKKNMKIYDTKEDAYNAADLHLKELFKNNEVIQYKDIIEITLEQYINLNKSTQDALKLYRVPVEYEHIDVDFDPWLLGYWLGDGDVVANIKNIVSKYDGIKFVTNKTKYKYNIASDSGKQYSNIFRNFLFDENLINNKHIPACYKYNSRKVRLGVLAGLIDSNGTLEQSKSGYAINMAQRYEPVIHDMVDVAKSLGFACYITYTTSICCNGVNGPVECPIISFTIYGEGIEEIPVILERKKAKIRESPKDNLMTGIKNIEVVEDTEYYGFELDGNGRFLLSDFTVTHNSSTVGVLTTGELDDGRGSARSRVLNFKHEVDTGRTSSISQQILGYDTDGDVVNHNYNRSSNKSNINSVKTLSWADITKMSSKIITFFDLAGHTKYSKTTIKGISSNSVDYAMIMVAANKGLDRKDNTIEHIRLCLMYKIPMIIILSKIDLCKSKEALDKVICNLKNIFKQPGSRKTIYKVNDMSDVSHASDFVKYGNQVPLFKLSNVTGEGLNLIHEFLNMIPPRIKFDPNKPVEYYIDSTYMIEGIGTVVGGFLASGTLKVGGVYQLGPDKNGNYREARVRSMHVKRTPVDQSPPGRYVCVNLPKIKRNDIVRGMVMIEVDPIKYPNGIKPIRKFSADIVVRENHSTSVKVGYEASMTIGTLRTTVKLCKIYNCNNINLKSSKDKQRVITENNNEPDIINDTPVDKQILKQGHKANVELELVYSPGYFNVDDRIVLSEGDVKIVGIVTSIL